MNLTKTSMLLCIAGSVILANATDFAGGVRYCGTFSIARHPIVVTQSASRSKVKAGAPGATTRTMALVDATFSSRELADAGWRVVSRIGEVVTLEGDAATGPYLGALQGIRYVHRPGRVYSQLDSARKFTNVDQVHGTRPGGIGRNLTGKKVLIGVIDTEFDTRHPAFLDSTGAIRFVAVWDQAARYSTGLPNSYRYGAIKNHAQILSDSLFGLDSLEPHGSMTTGLAAGSDKRYWKGPVENAYYGVAPDAVLAGVKMGSTDVNIVDGLNWLFSLADSLKLPCVVNMSLGTHNGPHDGTSLVDRAIDNHSTTPGHIVVGAAGNDGDKLAHVTLSVARNESTGTWITPVTETRQSGGVLLWSAIEMWGEAGKNFSTGFYILDTLNKTYKQSVQNVSTTANSQFAPDTVVWIDSATQKRDTVIFNMGVERSSALNGKPHLQAFITSTNPRLHVGISTTVSGTTGGTVHAWNLYKTSFESFGIPGFIAGDSSYSVNELGGTSKCNITVGSFTSKLLIPLWNGKFHDWGTDSTKPPHWLTAYSSHGPTVDGRIKPDIAAPGSDVTCPLARQYRGSADIVVWPDTTSLAGRYISTGGTSVAAPIVTGIVALLLEADPTLTYDKVRGLLQETAINDTATGVIGTNYNNRFGAGKVNALGAVAKLLGVAAFEKRNAADPGRPMFAIVKLSGNRLQLSSSNKALFSGMAIEVYSINGRCLAKHLLAKDGVMAGTFSELSKGYYMVRAVRKEKVLCSTAITVVE